MQFLLHTNVPFGHIARQYKRRLIWDNRMQYTTMFHGCKNDSFQMKICDDFLIFAQTIDRGYMLEPPPH